ncbi:MAG: MMPL family transporter [Solirubrobacteraceae bacterium]
MAVIGAGLALGLRPSAATNTFVGSSSSAYRATETFYANFGEEPIEVLVQGSLERTLAAQNLARLAGLEGCLAGRAAGAALSAEGGRAGPCGRLAALRAVRVVIGPGTFVNEAALEIDEQLTQQEHRARAQADSAQRTVYEQALARGEGVARARSLGEEARKVTLGAYAAEVATLGVQYGITSPPALGNAEFVEALVYDRSARAGTPKRRFAYLFPNANSALISIRLRAGLSEAQRGEAISLIRRATAMAQWRLTGGSYLVTGEPVIVSDLTGSLSTAVELLLLAVVIVMAGTLGLVFAPRPRLLPLALALLASALTLGALTLAGGSLTLGSLAVAPVLVGLAVDYAVQLQSRAAEEMDGGAEASVAVRLAAARGAPTIGAAALASGAAMLALLLSPVPLVQGFGALLIGGIALAFLSALTVGAAAMAAVHTGVLGMPGAPRGRSPGRRAAWLGASWRGARALVSESSLPGALAGHAQAAGIRRPRAVLSAAVVLALSGWGLAGESAVQTDITKLVPQNLASLEDLRTLERVTGVGGQVDLLLSGPSLTTPAAVEWMSRYESSVLAHFGYRTRGGEGGASALPACASAAICPAFSLPDLFAGLGSGGHAPRLSGQEIGALLNAIPQYFSQNVVSADRRYATLAFGIRLMALDRQQHVIAQMRAMLHPPAGVHASLVGLAVLAAQADADVSSSSRRALSLALSLLAVAVALLVAFRGDLRRAGVAFAPVALASGWSGLVLVASGVSLNPMSVSLSILVVAIATELSVLVCERYHQERLAGRDPIEALRVTYSSTGAAVAVSGVTAIAGFAVLALSQVQMLRDFGLVTLMDLAVSLVGVLMVLPSLLLTVDGGAAVRSTRTAGGPAWFRRLRG